MTKQKSTSVNIELVSMKLAVIKYHEANEYTEVQMAKDACFTSHNSVNWKKDQMAEVAAEVRELMPQRGTETVDVNLDKLTYRHGLMEEELYILEQRHLADLEVYKQLSGKTWLPYPRRKDKRPSLDERLAKFA